MKPIDITRGVVDLSSVLWTCLSAGKDKEHGKTVTFQEKEVFVNSFRWGYDNALNHLETVMRELRLQPHQLIFVKEGMNSKAGRQAIHPGYKAKGKRPPEAYEEFTKCRDMLIELFLMIGSNVVWQDGGVEGDDVIGYLAKRLKGDVWIITGDKDLAQCIGGRVHLYRRGEKDTNPFGPFDVRWIPTYIALVGDDADKIPGAKDFGKKSGEDLLITFGNEGLEALDGLIRTKQLDRLREDVAELKVLQKVIDDAKGVYMSYELARLRLEKVNTMQHPLEWRVGMVKPREEVGDAVMRKFGGTNRLVTKESYEADLDFLIRSAPSTPYFALDIESSTPPESDEWLEAQDKEDKVVDVFGSELTGFSITFGSNLHFTYYVSVDHVEEPGLTNVTKEQAKRMIQSLPRDKVTWVHSNSFELPVLFNSLGDMRVAS